jgi:hypothetical protein
MAALFELGKLTATASVAGRMRSDESFTRFVTQSLGRYQHGDWGNMDPEDKALNDIAVENDDGRIFAAYQKHLGDDIVKIWIITEADRSSTTIMFPEEY